MMTEKTYRAYQKLEDILSEETELSELINLMHYDPESLPEDAAKDLTKIEKQIKAALEIAKKISGNCER